MGGVFGQFGVGFEPKNLLVTDRNGFEAKSHKLIGPKKKIAGADRRELKMAELIGPENERHYLNVIRVFDIGMIEGAEEKAHDHIAGQKADHNRDAESG